MSMHACQKYSSGFATTLIKYKVSEFPNKNDTIFYVINFKKHHNNLQEIQGSFLLVTSKELRFLSVQY